MLHFFQVSRRPVQDAVAQQINKHVGDSDVPQQFVRQYVLHEDLLRSQLFFRFLVVIVRVIVLVLFDWRQTTGLRRITHQSKSKQRDNDRTESRHVQRRFPVIEPGHTQQEQQRRQTATHVMRTVPNGNDAATLFLRPPVHHGTTTRRPAHPLEPSAEEQQHKHYRDARCRPRHKAHKQHHCRSQYQTRWQENARIRAIRNGPHDEFRKSVSNGDTGQRKTQISTREPLLNQIRHRKGKVLTYQIVRGITKENPQKNLPT